MPGPYREIALQTRIAADTMWADPFRAAPIFAKVERLVGALTDAQRQDQAVSELISLGRDAVPSLVLLMDDRKPVGRRALRLPNRDLPTSELYRWYKPELVVDAVAALLNEITGQTFGSIQNGATEHQRATTVSAWRTFLYKTQTSAR